MNDKEDSARIKYAQELFKGPYNCSQSVAAAFKDVLGKDEDDILRLMSGFGFGMGGERTVCGAVSGGIFVISSQIDDPSLREVVYDKVFYLVSQFKKLNDGRLNCLDLVGRDPKDEDFKTICPKLIEQVITLVSKITESGN